MNKARRKLIAALATELEDRKTRILDLRDEEQEALEAMPEGLQDSARGEAAQAAIDPGSR